VFHPLLSRPRALGPYLLLWMAPASLLGAARLVTAPEQWRQALALTLPLCALYAFVCLGAWYPAQANPPGTPLPRLVGVQLLAAGTATALWLAVGRGWAALLARLLPGTPLVFDELLPLLVVAGVLLWLLAAAACYLFLSRLAANDAERQVLEAQVAAREAELRALRAQMDPHFLYNALNSVSALVGTDPAGARRMCEQLAGFLRGSLELDRAERIPLAKELALAHAFLQIERVRFGDRLRFVSEIDETAAAIEVPPLLLQPLVENALKHGIAHLVDGGTVTVQAKRRGATLYLVVENPLDPDRPASPGVALGLENVRRRLQTTYGERAMVVVDQRPHRFRVELRIPLPASGGDGTAGEGVQPTSPPGGIGKGLH
jgi:two-component system, LytTR family, sensor histidine kinase AlgZ